MSVSTPSKTLGPLKPNLIGVLFNTGFDEFASDTGICGLAKLKNDELDVLAIIATRPGTGQLSRFLRSAQQEFTIIRIHEVWNPALERILGKYGFKETNHTEREANITVWQWNAEVRPPIMKTPALQQTPLGGSDHRLVRQSFPDYGVEVEATTVDGENGTWSHGQYGWYPKGKWGIREYPHAHIDSWKYLPNVQEKPTP